MNLPAFTPQVLSTIEQSAELLLLPRDIATIIEVEPSVLISELKKENSFVYQHFYRGLLKKQADINTKYPIEDILVAESREIVNRAFAQFRAKLLIQLHYGH